MLIEWLWIATQDVLLAFSLDNKNLIVVNKLCQKQPQLIIEATHLARKALKLCSDIECVGGIDQINLLGPNIVAIII